MVLIAGRTRQDIRQAVGYNLDALFVGTLTSNGTTTTAVDTALRGGDDIHNGKWWRGTSATNEGITVQIDDYVESSNTLTFQEAITSTLSDDTYELWDQAFNPDRIDDFINQGIIDVTGLAFDPEEDESLHFDGETSRFDIPSNLAMIREVQYRSSVDSVSIHDCDRLFDETTEPDFTQALDTKDKKQGNASLRIAIAAAASAVDFITDSFASLDISNHTHVELWIKSNIVTVAAGDLQIILDDTAGAPPGQIEQLSIPILAADTWTFVRMALAATESDTALISIAFRYTTDLGAMVVKLDDIRSVNSNSARWSTLPRHLWSVDQEAGDLILTTAGVLRAGYAPMKLIGGDEPALLTSDASNSEVDPRYLIASTTGRAAAMAGGEHRAKATYWLGRAARMEQQFPVLQNVRFVK